MASTSPRERTEEIEDSSLSSWATRAVTSKGREVFEPPDEHRTAFQVDVDRIVAATAFERLKDKTHALLAPRGEGYRTRLDVTLAGARLARIVARCLRLNEDLVEAIALARDLGAPPFAHAGQEAFAVFTPEPFRHHEQSIRVVDRLEVREQGRAGLNLTWEVRDGILTHAPDGALPATPEGALVRLVDRVTNVLVDLSDALATGVLVADDLETSALLTLGDTPGQMRATVVDDIVAASLDGPEVRTSAAVDHALALLEAIVTERVHERHGVLAETARGIHCLRSLVVFYTDEPDRLPAAHRHLDDPHLVRVIDFVTSLSDSQALLLFNRHFLPRRSPHRL